jgi:hypothetical protein
VPSTQDIMRSADRLVAAGQAVGLTEPVAVPCQEAFKNRSSWHIPQGEAPAWAGPVTESTKFGSCRSSGWRR